MEGRRTLPFGQPENESFFSLVASITKKKKKKDKERKKNFYSVSMFAYVHFFEGVRYQAAEFRSREFFFFSLTISPPLATFRRALSDDAFVMGAP